jgi:hypothetical protein
VNEIPAKSGWEGRGVFLYPEVETMDISEKNI